MWKSFSAKNFRGFKSILLEPLDRVNLIAGKNNTGKTALLEAMHLHSYPQNCDLPFTLSILRGGDAEKRYEEDAAGWLFYNCDGSVGFELTSWNAAGLLRTERAFLVDPVTFHERFRYVEDAVGTFILKAPNVPRLLLETEEGGERRFAVGAPGNSGLLALSSGQPWGSPSIYLTSGPRSLEQDTSEFSEMEKQGRQESILPNLQRLEPRLRRLSLLLLAGKPVVHGNLAGINRPVPMHFLGEGIRRLLSILLAVGNASGGRVLIDEVENGLHYSVMKDTWKAIGVGAREANVQIVATTHSWECIQAAHHAFKESGPYEMRYHRLDRIRDEIVVQSIDRQKMDAIEKTDLEVR